MTNQAQIDAVEHLLMALLKSREMNMTAYKVFDEALGSIMGSDGPGGITQKTEAADYLSHLKTQL